MTFATDSRHIARKSHRCSICRCGISIGTPYLKLVRKWQGDFYVERAHDDCYKLWSAMFDDYGDPYDGMPYDLTDVLGDHARNDVQAELDAQRGFFPHPVSRLELAMKWLQEEETHDRAGTRH